LIGIRDRPTSFRSPWQNGYAERWIGSIWRECIDHVVGGTSVKNVATWADHPLISVIIPIPRSGSRSRLFLLGSCVWQFAAIYWNIAVPLKEAPMSVVEIVARKLGGRPVLGGVIRSQADLALAVRKRFPLAVLQGLAKAGLSDQEIEQFVIPQRTRRHRAEKKQPLTVEESDRAVRLLRVQTVAEGTFGDAGKANAWLRRQLAELHGETPLAVAQTEAGARVVETILGKIAWGAAA
jgi:putative toxin-antitoxin system antitoxin component (TIGR02293 family)